MNKPLVVMMGLVMGIMFHVSSGNAFPTAQEIIDNVNLQRHGVTRATGKIWNERYKKGEWKKEPVFDLSLYYAVTGNREVVKGLKTRNFEKDLSFEAIWVNHEKVRLEESKGGKDSSIMAQIGDKASGKLLYIDFKPMLSEYYALGLEIRDGKHTITADSKSLDNTFYGKLAMTVSMKGEYWVIDKVECYGEFGDLVKNIEYSGHQELEGGYWPGSIWVFKKKRGTRITIEWSVDEK